MILSNRLRAIREAKQLTQGDVEKRTGLLRSYISRVENGHAVPRVETLEKWAAALEVSVYRLFCDGENSPLLPNLPGRLSAKDIAGNSSGNVGRNAEHEPSSPGEQHDADTWMRSGIAILGGPRAIESQDVAVCQEIKKY
jgi:transcriptional regulator with XRE-family HTH domain